MAKKSKNLIKKTFEHWHPEELRETFGLKFDENLPELNFWLQSDIQPPADAMPVLERLRKTLSESYIDWNEAELLNKFIAPFLFWVDFSGAHFKTFAERPIKAVINQYELSGIVDFVAARGFDKPQSPYFFLHEYKRYKGTDANPLGQVLSAMLAAQKLNNEEQPLYGCFVAGREWTFVLLNGSRYATSKGFLADNQEELVKIWSILQETKHRVEEMAKGG